MITECVSRLARPGTDAESMMQAADRAVPQLLRPSVAGDLHGRSVIRLVMHIRRDIRRDIRIRRFSRLATQRVRRRAQTAERMIDEAGQEEPLLRPPAPFAKGS